MIWFSSRIFASTSCISVCDGLFCIFFNVDFSSSFQSILYKHCIIDLSITRIGCNSAVKLTKERNISAFVRWKNQFWKGNWMNVWIDKTSSSCYVFCCVISLVPIGNCKFKIAVDDIQSTLQHRIYGWRTVKFAVRFSLQHELPDTGTHKNKGNCSVLFKI